MFFRHHDPLIDRLRALGASNVAAERLVRAGTPLDLAAGTTLCQRGERGMQAFLLLKGEAEVTTAIGPVRIGPGSVIGEIATLDRTRHRNATVVTATDVSLLVFDVAAFRSLAADEELRDLLAPRRASVLAA
jgi:voltage-gated potassium channel